MSYDDFLRGFALVDVCKAHKGWHGKSFTNAFPLRDELAFRLCRDAYELKISRPTLMLKKNLKNISGI